MAASLDIRWSDTVRAVFAVQQTAGNAGDQIASTACLMGDLGAAVGVEPIYAKILVFVLLPPGIIAFTVLFWIAVYQYRVRWRK